MDQHPKRNNNAAEDIKAETSEQVSLPKQNKHMKPYTVTQFGSIFLGWCGFEKRH